MRGPARKVLILFFLSLILSARGLCAALPTLNPPSFPPYDEFRDLVTNRNNPAFVTNYPYLSFTRSEGIVGWIFKPVVADWQFETTENLKDWNTALYFRFNKTNSPAALVFGHGSPMEQSQFYRLRPVPSLYPSQLAKWRSGGITNYTFDYRNGCFCDPISGTVIVNGGRVVGVTNAMQRKLTGQTDYNPSPSLFPTIEDLFQRVADLEQVSESPYIEFKFDPVYGYPLSMYNETLSSEPQSFSATNFQPQAADITPH
jgi:hypothetical protein